MVIFKCERVILTVQLNSSFLGQLNPLLKHINFRNIVFSKEKTGGFLKPGCSEKFLIWFSNYKAQKERLV